MENPEMDFMLYLLNRFIEMNDIDTEESTVRDLLDKINEELTPIGGG